MEKILFKGIYSSLMLLIISIMGACTSNDEPQVIEPNERKDISLTDKTRAAAMELRDFYVDFTTDAVSYVDGDSKVNDKNVVVSPLSAYMSLAMLANGVEKEYVKDFTDYLGVEDLKALNELSASLLTELPVVDNQSQIAVANSVWLTNTHSFNTAFSEVMSSDYNASLFNLDFHDNHAVDKINQWCSDNTKGLIPGILDFMPHESLVFLINAMYYKGLWKGTPFLSEDTEKSDFHGLNGDSKIDMMYSKESLRGYYRDEEFESFSLNFGNGAFNMRIVLPNKDISKEKANELIASGAMSKISKDEVECNLTIYMPKFKVENKIGLNDVVEKGGLNLNNSLELNMMVPNESGLTLITQATSFEVDEQGAKAAAVTFNGMVSAPEPIEPNGSYTVRVDRPFYFFLSERSTGAVLLSGRIADL